MDQPSDEVRSAEAKNGAMKTALRSAIERTMQARSNSGQQIALFDDADRLPDDAGEGVASGPRGRGRPVGSSNKLTDAFRRFVRSQYGDPLLKLVERAFADPLVLGESLGLPAGQVWQAQNGILERLLPIFHSAMPAEVKVTTKGFLAVGIATAPGGLPAGDQVVEVDPFEAILQIAQSQGVSGQGQGLSNGGQSNDPTDNDDGSGG